MYFQKKNIKRLDERNRENILASCQNIEKVIDQADSRISETDAVNDILHYAESIIQNLNVNAHIIYREVGEVPRNGRIEDFIPLSKQIARWLKPQGYKIESIRKLDSFGSKGNDCVAVFLYDTTNAGRAEQSQLEHDLTEEFPEAIEVLVSYVSKHNTAMTVKDLWRFGTEHWYLARILWEANIYLVSSSEQLFFHRSISYPLWGLNQETGQYERIDKIINHDAECSIVLPKMNIELKTYGSMLSDVNPESGRLTGIQIDSLVLYNAIHQSENWSDNLKDVLAIDQDFEAKDALLSLAEDLSIDIEDCESLDEILEKIDWEA